MAETDAERIARENRATEQLGLNWQRHPDAFLEGYVAENRPGQFHTPAIVEMQRRFVSALQASSDCAATQTDEVIKLTRALKLYTIVLAAIGVVQIALMLWKA